MKNKDRDTAPGAAPQNDWRNAEADERMYLSDDDDDDTEDTAADTEEDDDDDDAGDWGHVDPVENTGPFPDDNEPTAPGSAV